MKKKLFQTILGLLLAVSLLTAGFAAEDKPEQNTAPETEIGTEAVPEAALEPESDPEAGSENGAEEDAWAAPEPDGGEDTGPGPEASPEPAPEKETAAGEEAEADTEADADPAPESEPDPESDPDLAPVPDLDTETNAEPAPEQQKPVFSDVSEEDWFYEPVEYLTSEGILRGFEDGTFRPQDTMTRAQFLKLMLAPFVPDAVEPEGSKWWKPYADYGQSVGLLTKFDILDPDKPITRNRVARLLARLSLLPEAEGYLIQADRKAVLAELGDLEEIPSYDLEAVIQVYAAGLMRGYDDGCFHAERTMTRAEGAMLTYRYLVPEKRRPLLRYIVPEEWFDDALLLGNSLCGGISMYGELPEPDILYSSGGSIFGSPDGLYHDRGDVGHLLWLRLSEVKYGKIILIYGTNEMTFESEYFYDHYAAFLDRLEELQPDAELFLCTAPPVNEGMLQEGELSNQNCRRINEVIRRLAKERGLGLLDVWAFFADETGSISASDTWDGIHLTPESCLRWTEWLRSAVLQT